MKYRLGDYTIKNWNDWDRVPRDPVTIGTYIATALGITSTVGTYLVIAGTYLAITAVTSWALRALSPKPTFGSAADRGLLTNTRNATAPQEIIYGEIRKGGTVSFLESTGETNQYLHQVIVLAGHEVNSIGNIYINDEVVTLDADGFVTDEKWVDEEDNPKIRIKKHTGSDSQAADSDLVSETSVTSDFKGQGIAYIYVRMEFDPSVFAEGIPLFTAKIQGKKVYDPRSGSTAYSANAALCIRDYLVSAYGLANAGDTNDTSFQAAANTSDESVTMAGSGTQSRYEINGVITLDQSPSDILADMMTACAGTLFWGQGEWHLKVGEYTSPVKTFTLDDLRGPINLDTKHSRRDNFNIVRGTFVDANQKFIRADYPEIRASTFITNDNGVESALDLALPLTTSAAMAQRLAKMTLFRAREQMTFTADFGLEAFEVECGDIVALTIDRYGWTAKEFEVVGWKFKNDGDAGDLRVALTLRETSAAAFDWDAEEGDIDDNDTDLDDPSASLTIASLLTSGGGRTTSDGTFVNSVIVSWTAPSNSFVTHYDVEWKPTADSSYAATTTSETSIELSPLIDGVSYTIRVRAVTSNGRKGPFVTATFTGGGDTTAPALPTNITATGGFEYITIAWTNPSDADLNYIEVYENTTNSSSGATKVGVSAGDRFTRTNLGLNETKYYFLKAVDYSGNASGFTAGVSATTTYLDDEDFENGVRQLFIDAGLDIIEPVSSLPPSGDFEGQQVFLTTDSKLYHWTGTEWLAVVADVDIAAGSITTTEIADDAITTPKLTAEAITGAKIAGDTITGNKIVANTITGGLLATSGIITSVAQIGDGLVERAKIKDAAIDTLKVAGESITLSSFVDFSTVTLTNGVDKTFSTSVNMEYDGSIVVIGNITMFGSAGSGDTATYRLFIDGVQYQGVIFTGSLLLGLHTLAGGKAVSSGSRTIELEIADTSGITNPRANADMTILRRYR